MSEFIRTASVNLCDECGDTIFLQLLLQCVANFHATGPVTIKVMQTPTPPLRNGQIFMKYAECAELNEKRNILYLRFLFSELSRKFIENWGGDVTKMTKNHNNSKNKNWKNLKVDLPFNSADLHMHENSEAGNS